MAPKIKIRLSDLKRLVQEELTIIEADESPEESEENEDPTAQILPKDSLDDQVDKFFIKGEKRLEESLYRRLVIEAAPEDELPDLEGDMDGGNESPDKPAAVEEKNLDPSHYAKVVARLIMHAEDLLDLQNTILRRALNYVTKNYDSETAKKVEEVLESDYELSLEKRDLDHDVEVPAAAGAGNGGGGMGGAPA